MTLVHYLVSAKKTGVDIFSTGVNVMEDNTTENSKSMSNPGVSGNRFQTTTLEVQVARQQFTTHDTTDIG